MFLHTVIMTSPLTIFAVVIPPIHLTRVVPLVCQEFVKKKTKKTQHVFKAYNTVLKPNILRKEANCCYLKVIVVL